MTTLQVLITVVTLVVLSHRYWIPPLLAIELDPLPKFIRVTLWIIVWLVVFHGLIAFTVADPRIFHDMFTDRWDGMGRAYYAVLTACCIILPGYLTSD